MAPIETPTPIPAFAPVESSLSPVAIGVLDGEDDTVEDATEDAVEEETNEDVTVGIGSPNRAAIVYRVIKLPSAQHSFVPPQHQVKESTAPVQGVTGTSVLLRTSS